MPKILVIDNYDSFVYNLVQYLGELGADTDTTDRTEPSRAHSDTAPQTSEATREADVIDLAETRRLGL